MQTRLNSIIVIALVWIACSGAAAQDAPQAEGPQCTVMTNGRLDTLIKKVDEKAQRNANSWEFQIDKYPVTVITDERADRMRIVVPVAKTDGLSAELLYRMMQANFDSALDARYSIAQGILWSAFIHPLSALEDKQFLSALGQTVNLAETYGTTFSSGALVFGGGDSGELNRRQRIERLLESATEI